MYDFFLFYQEKTLKYHPLYVLKILISFTLIMNTDTRRGEAK